MTSVKQSRIPDPKRIAFQGAPGAYSDLSCRAVFPKAETMPCSSFEDAFAAVSKGTADLAMIPIENSLAGRVADVHHLMPASGLHIVGEHFQPIRHCLLGIKGSKISQLKRVHSHVMALPQCRKSIRELKLHPVVHEDTAGAAAKVAHDGNPTEAAIASELAAEIYGLQILKRDMQDRDDNVTRFVILSKAHIVPKVGEKVMTSFAFGVRNIPAALYKSLGGFATNGINMTKIESYLGEGFAAAEFYCEVEGHPDDKSMHLAFEELEFYANGIKVLGTFPMHAYRKKTASKN
ncbi:MAG: prephenate dehydratase [Alphaproteobacteria bacterium]|nr:prephenate dehydratase [Alphaproteobacteria bacterium]